MLIACPTCGRLQFDMDTVVAEIEERLADYEDPIEVSVLGCAVNGIGEARHADFGITGAKDMGMIYSRGEPLKKVPTERLVDELFAEIDRYYAAGKRVVRDESDAAEARAWLAENEDATAMTPERLAALEAAQAREADELSVAGCRRGRLAGGRTPLHPRLSAGARRSPAARDSPRGRPRPHSDAQTRARGPAWDRIVRTACAASRGLRERATWRRGDAGDRVTRLPRATPWRRRRQRAAARAHPDRRPDS